MKRFLLFLLRKISRLIYKISGLIWLFKPNEFKNTYLNSHNYLNRKLQDKSNRDTYKVFGKELKKSIRWNDEISIRKYAIDLAIQNHSKKGINKNFYYLEFGVYKGTTANLFSKYVKKLYAFDSFEGLPREWEGNFVKGTFNLNKKIPKLRPNVEPIVGLVEETLDNFLKEHNPKINFVHFDMDLYDSTKFVLKKIKPFLLKGSIILFDELYNYINWDEGEYKALIEVFDKEEYKYRSFNITGFQAAIEIL